MQRRNRIEARLMPAVLILLIIAATGVAALPRSASQARDYHGNLESHIFHQASCRYYACKACTATFKSREEAITAGYRPCKICKP